MLKKQFKNKSYKRTKSKHQIKRNKKQSQTTSKKVNKSKKHSKSKKSSKSKKRNKSKKIKMKMKGGGSFVVKGINIEPDNNFSGLTIPDMIASFTDKFKC